MHRFVPRQTVCGTKTRLSTANDKVQQYVIPPSVKLISYEDLQFDKANILGEGTFGKCIKATLAHLNTCIKIFKDGATYESTFAVEATLLSHCCHANLPWLYGVVHQPKIIILSLHTMNDHSVTLHSMLCIDCGISPASLTSDDWKKILYGIILATDYLHSKTILHNDIKANNIVIEGKAGEARSVLIDLGKGCFTKHAKAYYITNDAKRKEHTKKYPHIAPDLINGHCKQSEKSDIYALGRIIKMINDNMMHVPALESTSGHCMEYLCNQRPSILDLKTFIHNLFY